MLKRVFAIILSISLICLCTACGADSKDTSSTNASSKTSSVSPSSKNESTPDKTGNNSTPTASNKPVESEKPLVKIMPLGDSLTQGGQHKTSAYRGFLSEMLTKGGYNTKFVGCNDWSKGSITDGNIWHSGFGGAKTYTLGESLPTMKNCDPDIILLMIGRNDMTEGTNPDQLVQFIDKYLVTELYKMFPDVHIFVASVPVIRDMAKEQLNTKSDDLYVPVTKAYVEEQKKAGKKMDFVDMSVSYTGLKWEDFTAEDFVHPLPDGYKKIAQRWYDCITDKIEEIADSKAAA